MSRNNKILIGLLIFSLITISIVLYNMGTEYYKADEQRDNQQESIKVNNKPLENPNPEPKEVVTKETITLAMLGDVLLHKRLAVYDEFMSSFEPMKSVMESYDYLIANQESPPVGNKFPVSGYPQFSSPEYIIRDLKGSGVDMINIANNHIVDKGESGVRTVFENIEQYGLPYVGAYQSEEDALTDRIIEVKGISIGIISYTYGTNGLYLPEESPFIINYIDEARIVSDIKAMKDKADVTVVHLHWGPEFTTQEAESQRQLAQAVNEAGADILFGTHPHVLQPYSKLTNSVGKETHVFYSLGNYFSTTITSTDSMVGGIGSLNITKEGEEILISNPTLHATAMLLDEDGKYRVYPLAEVEGRATQNLQWVKDVLGEGIVVQ
ncbi:CapA family protein [Lysinibacillus sp. 54212]|uniref:CapA family protein n=1 Tax=Lysinibacillus sp. 54212 TaxID=3119829 RepID=UPI002FCC10FB